MPTTPLPTTPAKRPKVETLHARYQAQALKWRRMRDCEAGEDAIKGSGRLYLPSLEDQQDGDYHSYKARASFYGATKRSVQGLQGAIMRKAPDTVWPEGKRVLLENIGASGESIESILSRCVRESLLIGRVGILTDAHPAAAGQSPDPYLAIYPAEDIINWRTAIVDGETKPIMVVLQEIENEAGPGGFENKEHVRYRVLRLGRAPAIDLETGTVREEFNPSEVTTPFYYQEVWAKNKDGEYDIVGTTVPRLQGGKLLREIPFVFISADESGNDVDPHDPPLLDLANLNISHYRNSADLEHGLHFTALPTPWAAGFKVEGNKLRVGPMTAWVTENHEAKVGMLEFTGNGLGSIVQAMERKERQMAALGSRMLEVRQGKNAEATDTVRLRQSGEQSALTLISQAVGRAVTKALRWFAAWAWNASEKEQEDISLILSGEFQIAGMEAQQIQALMLALQSGAISWETWFYNLARSEIMPDGVTSDEEKRLIAAGNPLTIGMPGLDAEDDEDDVEDSE